MSEDAVILSDAYGNAPRLDIRGAETHHDSATVNYCSPALSGRLHSEQQGILREASRHLSKVAADTGTQ